MDAFLVLVLLLCVFLMGVRVGRKMEPIQPSSHPGAGSKEPRARPSSPKAPLEFLYEDADGKQSLRVLENWRVEGPYLHGICRTVEAERTFRKDRVLCWYGDSRERMEGRGRLPLP